MKNVVPVSREENENLVPTAWRQVFIEIVDAFARGDFQLNYVSKDVEKISKEDAEMIEDNLRTYGANLVPLPEESWSTSVCQWVSGYWDVMVDLYTVEEGKSDLVLSARVFEVKANVYKFQVNSIHVP
ncbi:DUF7668 domain-containing protein [Xanthomonas sacchari]|uniref:DUF7668 domain-containing protein n=1 Tax=Xanthomonas sacchari TaxID=56458 RepID=UPI0022520651|nr:hypothetical protein [Xanthomonas sacchari]